jgi:alanyl aminopeptidase
MRRPVFSLALFLLACGGTSTRPAEFSAAEGRAAGERGDEVAPAEAPAPEGRLPEGVTPLAYDLALEVVPSRERFRGSVDIRVRLDASTTQLFLHGARMDVTAAEVLPDGLDPVRATWEETEVAEVGRLRFAEPIEAGEAILSLRFDAPFDRQLKGLYRVDVGDDRYAFTQFEATSARYAFPCFDEPRFKTPFRLTLSVPADGAAIANTRVVREVERGDLRVVSFAPTEPLPTYLVAMAVGPLDVVEVDGGLPANDVRAEALPFRGVAARGQGPRLAHALAHTAELLTELETYFGIPYPYDKLDIIAVPDFASGAMENAGAITFRETLLLLDDDAPENQRRRFAYVMAHELAHQWFGNLVTMPWWDDIWLNEAFATWMGNRVIQRTHPEYEAELSMVQAVQGAMRQDALASARQIRQPVADNDDIRNAFDGITYRKGGGVLRMFERYLGADTFRAGLRAYMATHRFGTATYEDLLAALSETSGRDVATPFRTFLFQPGVPAVEAERACEGGQGRVTLRQRRYRPAGSTVDPAGTWQIPVCVRHGRGRTTGETCTLLTDAERTIDVEGGCPEWIHPNAAAAGYYHVALPEAELTALLQRGYGRLSPLERLALADGLSASFEAGSTEGGAVLEAMRRLAADESRAVATAPMATIAFAREHGVPEALRGRVEAFAVDLYGRRARRMGWTARRRESGEAGLLRRSLLGFVAGAGQDARTRREAARRGVAFIGSGDALDPGAVEAELRPLALSVAVQEGDAALFDRLLERFLASSDALFRSQALGALASTQDPAPARRALALELSPALRVNEVTSILRRQLEMPETRDAAWAWLQEHFDEVYERVATTRAGYAPYLLSGFCAEERAREIEAFFAPRIAALPGGPRNLRAALERIRLCAARVEAQRASLTAFFTP